MKKQLPDRKCVTEELNFYSYYESINYVHIMCSYV